MIFRTDSPDNGASRRSGNAGLAFVVLLLVVAPLRAEEVRVAVAANFLATLQALAPDYEAHSGDRLIISAGSSGKLYAQIVNGAPFDVFLAADQSYPARLEQGGHVVPGSRFVYARGRLVLWSADARPIEQADLQRRKGRIAIANPRTAPYGLAAQQTLEALGLWDSVQPRLVQGESVGQAFQFAASGNAALAFVALSQVLNPANSFNRRHYWLVEERMHSPLVQEAALLARSAGSPGAQRFLDYLRSDEARRAIERNGYH